MLDHFNNGHLSGTVPLGRLPHNLNVPKIGAHEVRGVIEGQFGRRVTELWKYAGIVKGRPDQHSNIYTTAVVMVCS